MKRKIGLKIDKLHIPPWFWPQLILLLLQVGFLQTNEHSKEELEEEADKDANA